MRVFIDTNVILEYLCGRRNAWIVRDFLDSIDEKHHEAFISSSSLCTISYYVELALKEQGIHKPEKTYRTRNILKTLLDMVTILDISHTEAVRSINDESFSDFEDSLQYQCARRGRCDVIVTFNVKDFKNIDHKSISVLTPKDFVNGN